MSININENIHWCCSEKVLWNIGVQRTVKIHERYLRGNLTASVTSDAVFLKINSLISVFEEVRQYHSFN